MTRWDGGPDAYEGRHRRTSIGAVDLVHLATDRCMYIGAHRPCPTYCQWCDGLVRIPVRDAEAVAWIGDGAATYCSTVCLRNHSEERINADGNPS